jgi:flagellar biosynthesis/type III secretory pathway protein FliH
MKDTPYGMIAANMGKGFRHSVSVADKERLRKKMQDFESFLEQNPFVQKKKEEGIEQGREQGIEIGIEQGREQGREEGVIEASQKAVVTIIEGRFPELVELAQRKVTNINKIDALALMIRMVSTAPDEATARFILNTKVA